MFGVLQRADTNATLNDKLIELWIDGLIRESMLTTTIGTPMGPQSGAYLFTRSISASGDHELKVKFPGTETLAASNSEAETIVTTTLTEALIKIAVPASIVLAIMAYYLR